MKTLITAGNTQTPIDRVRCITNIFTGKTGGQIAMEGLRRGHAVTLLTSHPEVVRDSVGIGESAANIEIRPYRTFEDLETLMEEELLTGNYEILIHCAAVSDYHVSGIYVPEAGTGFDPVSGRFSPNGGLLDVSAGKVKSHHPELWMRFVPTPKLADRVRGDWKFRGRFVKFKLEVGVSDSDLQTIAGKSRVQSDADYIVANTLEERHSTAFIGDRTGDFARISRPELAARLWDRLEIG